MLEDEALGAVKKGKFHIWEVGNIAEVKEILKAKVLGILGVKQDDFLQVPFLPSTWNLSLVG